MTTTSVAFHEAAVLVTFLIALDAKPLLSFKPPTFCPYNVVLTGFMIMTGRRSWMKKYPWPA